MTTIRRFGNVAEAGFARSLLEAAGIDATLADEYAAALGPPFAPWGIRLQVDEEDVERSLKILDGKAGLDSQPPSVTLEEAVPVEHEVNSPTALEAKPVNLTCPNCGTGWELTAEEAGQETFTCDECQTNLPVHPYIQLEGRIGFFLLIGAILAAGGIGLHMIWGLVSKPAYTYYLEGATKESKGDLDGAMADYTQAIALDPKDPKLYIRRGGIEQIRGDLVRAMADYNQSIGLDPKDAILFVDRGMVKREEGDYDGAIADDDQAIELDPQRPEPYCRRGNVKIAKGDYDGAIADANKAISLAPETPRPYLVRGFARQVKGDLDGAMVDYNQAVVLNLKYAFSYNCRGNAYALMRNWNAALQDYDQCCDLSPTGQDYPRLYMYLIRARLGESQAASKDLSAYIDNRKNSRPWPAEIARYLLGGVTEADFFAAAGSPYANKAKGQTCEAWYFVGMKTLLDGDKKAAADCFSKCIETEQKDCVEFGLAQSELKALGKLPLKADG